MIQQHQDRFWRQNPENSHDFRPRQRRKTPLTLRRHWRLIRTSLNPALPLRAAVGTVTGEPPDPQGWHPAVDYLALLNCLLLQLRDAEQAGAHVLLLVTDSRNFLSIPHFPYFIRHLVARMQWEGTYREKWFPIFVNTLEAGLAAVHFTWTGGPRSMRGAAVWHP